MNTKTKGDILAERVEAAFTSPFHNDTKRLILEALADYRKPLSVLTPAQIADGWLEWHGGECPVWGGSIPKVMFRDGEVGQSDFPANHRCWGHTGVDYDIIAYRPDPYEKEKKAHSEGKVIQWKYPFGSLWIECNEKCPPQWLREIKYRVKPEPVMVPLGPEDVPPGSAVRYSENSGAMVLKHAWSPIKPVREKLPSALPVVRFTPYFRP